MFIPTCRKDGEIRKARFKNWNHPILIHMYNGPNATSLSCVMSGSPDFKPYYCITEKKNKLLFSIEYNHIRQRKSTTKTGGVGHSVDKNGRSPSDITRSLCLDNHLSYLIEFMCMMPVSMEEHKKITKASHFGDIILNSFPKEVWPWVLQNATNFNSFCKEYNLDLQYRKFINHLNDVDAPRIDRLVGRTNHWSEDHMRVGFKT